MRITEPGRYDLPMSIYHGQPTATGMSLSASGAITLSDYTPAHLRQSWIEPRTRERRADLGTCIHLLLLEPLRREAAIKIIDAPDYKTKAAQQAADDALNAGMTPILTEQFDAAMSAVDMIRTHSSAAELLERGTAEQSYFSRYSEHVWLKTRPDIVNGAGTIINIKSVKHAQPEFIRRRIYQGGWFMSAPWECMVYQAVTGKEPSDYLWICVEQAPPHAVAVYRPKRETMIVGARKNQAAIATFEQCVCTGNWPGYPVGVTEIGLPDFAYYRLEEEAMADDE